MNIGYIRVSTIEQNEKRQVESLKDYNIEKWYIEKASGKDTNRPKLQEMLDYVREGDTVYIYDFSRLARNTKDLLEIVEKLNNKEVHLISCTKNFDTSTAVGKLMLTMLGAIAQFEREIILERQREGIAIAKAEGKYKGKQKIKRDNFEKLYKLYLNRGITKVELAKQLHISRPTLDRMIKEYEEEHSLKGTHTNIICIDEFPLKYQIK